MDTIFLLGEESRRRILHRAAACLPGCAYICAWAPAPLPPPQISSSSSVAVGRLIYCVDAWFISGGDGDVRQLFDAYRGSVCAAVTGCVPGWAYIGGGEYMELPEIELAGSASLPVQQRFYQEAGIKMAAFMGCDSGEIEVGFSTPPAANYGVSGGGGLQANMEQVFSEDFFQQSLLEEFLQLSPTRPSSSSSSPLPSLSVDGSPAAVDAAASTSSSLLLRPIPPSSSPSPTTTTILHPRHVSPFARHAAVVAGAGIAGGGVLEFPSADADDAAMAQAMLHVISSSPSTPSSASANHMMTRSPRRGTATAFRPYAAALAPRRRTAAGGQRMIKMGISILRRMHMVRCSQEHAVAAGVARRGNEGGEEEDSSPAAAAAGAAPTSSQLHHMISERRRRERLNESFEQLRALLPPGSKKDKATVLAKTLEYMNLLIAQISELESTNRSLQLQTQIHHQHAINGPITSSMIRTVNEVHHHHQLPLAGGGIGSPERVHVQVIAGGGASSSSPEVTVRVAARGGGGDVSELVLRLLKLIKEMGRFTVVAVDARQPAAGGGGGGGGAQASLTLRAMTAGEFDEASLKEAVTKAVENLVTSSPPLPMP